MVFFSFTGVVADLDNTTADNPCHPATVLLIECGEHIERVVLPADVWPGGATRVEARDVLHVGRRVRIGGRIPLDMRSGSLPVTEHMQLLGLH